MTDSTIVRYSGDWAFNSGEVAAGAKLYVYNSGTSNLASIFSDKDLSVALANPVTADSAGLMPFAYIGDSAYKVILQTSGGATIDSEDSIPGALDTDPFAAATFAKPDTDVSSKTSDYTMVAADLGTIINCNVTGGNVQITLLSAITASNGRGITIRHVGTANYVKIVSVSSQTITKPNTGVTTTAFSLVGYGESVSLKSDGANWHVDAYVPPLINATTGVIAIADRVSSAPAGPNPGARYIVTAAFSTYEQEDIIEADGQGSFIEITPPTDCGWMAYVQDENAYYSFQDSAWVAVFPAASDTVAGLIEYADQTEMEAGSSTTRAVTPGRQHFHPAACKVWGSFNVSGAILASYNVTSITDTGTGVVDITIATDFSSANWAALATAMSAASNLIARISSKAAGTAAITVGNDSGAATDPTSYEFAGFGDL